jgi:hypothetical protein
VLGPTLFSVYISDIPIIENDNNHGRSVCPSVLVQSTSVGINMHRLRSLERLGLGAVCWKGAEVIDDDVRKAVGCTAWRQCNLTQHQAVLRRNRKAPGSNSVSRSAVLTERLSSFPRPLQTSSTAALRIRPRPRPSLTLPILSSPFPYHSALYTMYSRGVQRAPRQLVTPGLRPHL